MSNPIATDFRVFAPSKSLAVSKAFYTALGWKLNWEDEGLAELELAGVRFLLQKYYAKEWAENFMFHVDVPDAQAWYDHAAAVIATGQFPGARVTPPKHESWGAIVTYVWDPCGVLIHFAQWVET